MSGAPSIRFTTCYTGKRGYASKAAAREANMTNHHSLRFYQCDTCHLWHAAKRSR